MIRVRFLPGAVLCYAISYLVVIALALRKGMNWDGYSLVVWLVSAMIVFVGCAAVPLLAKLVGKIRATTFLWVWAGTIIVLGTALVLNAK